MQLLNDSHRKELQITEFEQLRKDFEKKLTELKSCVLSKDNELIAKQAELVVAKENALSFEQRLKAEQQQRQTDTNRLTEAE